MDEDPAGLHSALVDRLLGLGVLTQPAVEAAFRAVPRHLFLPDFPISEVYRDEAIATKMEDGRAISSSSQPAIMAIMLEQLNALPGQRVLEIGAGTGYNAALLGRLVGPSGQVVTVDIDDDIAVAARAHLAAAGSDNVQVICGDGGHGYGPAAPYDRIILTVGAWDVTPAWYDQLGPGGRLVLPLRVATGAQRAVAFDKAPVGVEPRFVSQSVRDCGFMVLRGAFAGSEFNTPIGPNPGLTVFTPAPIPASAEQIYAWLQSPSEPHASGLRTTPAEVFGSLGLWLELHAKNLSGLNMEGVPRGGWPCLFEFPGARPVSYTFGLLQADGMALLDRGQHGGADASWRPDEQELFELFVLGYGPHGPRLDHDLVDLLAIWDRAGRLSSIRLRLWCWVLQPGGRRSWRLV